MIRKKRENGRIAYMRSRIISMASPADIAFNNCKYKKSLIPTDFHNKQALEKKKTFVFLRARKYLHIRDSAWS